MQGFSNRFKILPGARGARYAFYCGICGRAHITREIPAQDAAAALLRARDEARAHFNCCHRCRRWVCDADYDEGVMLCRPCAALLRRELTACERQRAR